MFCSYNIQQSAAGLEKVADLLTRSWCPERHIILSRVPGNNDNNMLFNEYTFRGLSLWKLNIVQQLIKFDQNKLN